MELSVKATEHAKINRNGNIIKMIYLQNNSISIIMQEMKSLPDVPKQLYTPNDSLSM